MSAHSERRSVTRHGPSSRSWRVRGYLEHLAGAQQLEAELSAFEQSALSTPGRSKGWKFDREEANRRA
jgi:hypothetical protein